LQISPLLGSGSQELQAELPFGSKYRLACTTKLRPTATGRRYLPNYHDLVFSCANRGHNSHRARVAVLVADGARNRAVFAYDRASVPIASVVTVTVIAPPLLRAHLIIRSVNCIE
jgi:hypothetical protein